MKIWGDDFDKHSLSSSDSHLPQFQDLLLDLEGLVVRELDHVRLCLEEWLVDVHLGVAVDAVVGDVEVLNDLRLGKLVDDASPRLLVFD